MPGLVNAHAHLELPALMNSLRSRDYASWVLNLLKTKASLRIRDYHAAVRNNIRNLIRSGTTTVAEITTHNVSPEILAKSGLRAVVYHEVIAMRPGSTISLPPRKRDSTLIHHGLSPHSPHTVSEEGLVVLRRHAKKHKLSLCMHVAETKDELLLLRRRKSGLERLYAAAGWDREWAPRAHSSFQYLDRLGLLGPGFLAVHAVHASAYDVGILARAGASVAHCPRSNQTLRVGAMKLRAILDAGIPVGLGTDSLASVPTLNLWDEMRAALRMHMAKGMTARDILLLATLGGAKAIGLEDEIGSLEVGKKADIIAVPSPRKTTADIYADLLKETDFCLMTMVDGRKLY